MQKTYFAIVCLFLAFSAITIAQNVDNIVYTSDSNLVNDPGDTRSGKFTLKGLRRAERSGADNDYPIKHYTLYLVDIHFVSGNISAQYIAYHFCHFVNADFMVCQLFNDTSPNARSIGNEYFITKKIFDTLPFSERHLWHSHPFEIKSGLFVAPDLSEEDEWEVMAWLMGTFGKVTDTWQFDEEFPFGAPKLGMALALDSQVNWTLAEEMDRVLNLPTTYEERSLARKSLVTPPRTPGADNYLFSGFAKQYKVYDIFLEDHGKYLPGGNEEEQSDHDDY